jgi:hypothetical protein
MFDDDDDDFGSALPVKKTTKKKNYGAPQNAYVIRLLLQSHALLYHISYFCFLHRHAHDAATAAFKACSTRPSQTRL